MVPFFLGTPCRRHQSDTNAGKVQPAGAGWMVQGIRTGQAGKDCVCMERASLRPQAAPTPQDGTTDQGGPTLEGTTVTPCLPSTGPRPHGRITPPGRGGRVVQGWDGERWKCSGGGAGRDCRTGGERRTQGTPCRRWDAGAPEGFLVEDAGMDQGHHPLPPRALYHPPRKTGGEKNLPVYMAPHSHQTLP